MSTKSATTTFEQNKIQTSSAEKKNMVIKFYMK